MGLAISRSIIEAHRGRLWAEANAPRGAVFQFTLPIRDENGLRLSKAETQGFFRIGVPLSSEPKRTLSSDRPNLSALGMQVVQR